MNDNQSIDQTTSKTTSKIESREFVIERIFDAPRELVFKAFTEPERLAQWFGPRGWKTTSYTMDLRPGGVWHYCMVGPDGTESWGKAIYQEIVPPERLVYTDVFSDKDGNAAEGMPEIHVTLEFVEQDGKTRLINRAQFPSAQDLQSVLEMGMEQGLTETWDRLEEFLAQEQAA